ncbi:MAG: bifunctional adenosylcobinamide kinase/adenosylcobinamide-phosphate guanylyltransferase [Dehalococcoidales bacterium]|nr:bifunctional adenosylcobinamide kinase/adenosylcobinamide-phosphate guanylyltransferase [Dehalococcoidales bacterium]
MRTNRVVLLLGGARSGKSNYAQELAWQSGGKVLFVATAEAGNEEMRLRIEKHKQNRPAGWRTLEATGRIGSRIENEIGDAQTVIIDCITLLVSNVFCRYDEKQFEEMSDALLEQEVMDEINRLCNCLNTVSADFIIVSNEVGLGIVPENRMGRLYRDILGRANQVLASSAREVYFMAAGIPMKLKPQ